MGLIELIVIIFLAGLFCWVVNRLTPPDYPPFFKNVIYVIVVVVVILYVLQCFGLLHGIHDIRIGK